MATLTITYVDKCAAADPHVTLQPSINGVEQDKICLILSDLTGPLPDGIDKRDVLIVLLRNFCREWKVANPSGTLVQLRNALNSKTWQV